MSEDNRITPTENGPLHVEGNLSINGESSQEAWLCRCGQSQNKPFCDGSHRQAGFADPGSPAVGDATLTADGSSLQIRTAKDGPLLVNGYFRLFSESGELKSAGKKAALCRCGQSKNKPFCDGTHKGAGFTAA